ncbi:MAG: hypothetical protein HY720_18685, partial [Planctomycetes bacterium]|nr:hypothetical protein [Planctomycetota bacterium]
MPEMDDHRAALVRARSRVFVRLAVEMGMVSEEDAKAVLVLQEKDLSGARASFVARCLVEKGLLSREDAGRVRERQERVSLICETCLAVYRIEGKSPGTRLACKCGNALVVPGAGETGETVLAERAAVQGGASSEGAVAKLLSTRRLPPPLALPGVREALARAGRERFVPEQSDRWLDTDLARKVAVRSLDAESALLPAVRARFLAEARLAAQFRGLEVLEATFHPDPGPGPVLVTALKARGRGRTRLGWLDPFSAEHGGTPEERARRAAEAFFGEAERPQVLLLDDVDLADFESRLLVDALVEECARPPADESGRRRGAAIIATSRVPPSRRVAGQCLLALKRLGRRELRELFTLFLKPLSAPERLVREVIAAAEGSPLEVRRIAMALKEDWGECGVVPPSADLPSPTAPQPRAPIRRTVAGRDEEVYGALAVLRRPASAEDVACAIEEPVLSARRSLRRLAGLEAVRVRHEGGVRRYQPSSAQDAEQSLRAVPPKAARTMHARLARRLRAQSGRSPRDHENLARHLLACGDGRSGIDAALEAAGHLRRSASHDRAIRLLEEAAPASVTPDERWSLAEEMSSILEEVGDHRRGIAVLEPFLRERALRQGDAVRVLRRFGVHCHRSGCAERALAAFEEARSIARARRDLEELVFIDSELAEIHIFRGAYDEAEAACRRGLDRIRGTRARGSSLRHMEVVLRASLGHLELRRMRLRRARAELRTALRLCRRHGSATERSAILTNLGIAESQLNAFASARRRLEEAERLLLRARKTQSLVTVATNLAVLEAKVNDRDEARMQVERAAQLVRRCPGQRLEFFATYARGVVAHDFGEAVAAAEALEKALAMGRRLRDRHLVGFG